MQVVDQSIRFWTVLWLVCCKPGLKQVSLQGEDEVAKLAERMQNLLRPFVLRRLKTEVANQLAPKKHELHRLAMTDQQAKLYSEAVRNLRKDLAPSAGQSRGFTTWMADCRGYTCPHSTSKDIALDLYYVGPSVQSSGGPCL